MRTKKIFMIFVTFMILSLFIGTCSAETISENDFSIYITYPTEIPTGNGYSLAISDDDTYLAVGSYNEPRITIYKQNGDEYDKLEDPSTIPTGSGYGSDFSPDNTYLAVAHSTSPYLSIYKNTADNFSKLSNPSTLPTGTAYTCDWDANGTYLAVGHSTSRYVTIYKRDGDTFSNLSDPDVLPAGNGRGVAFSHDDTYLAVAHSTSPYITIYKRDGDNFTKLSDPADLPTNTGYGVSWSFDSTYLAVAHSTSPYITIYKRSGDTFTKMEDPVDLPEIVGYSLAFSKTSNDYLAVQSNYAPYLHIYKQTADNFSKIEPDVYPPDNPISGGCTEFNSDDSKLFLAHSNYPCVSVYNIDGDTFTKIREDYGNPTFYTEYNQNWYGSDTDNAGGTQPEIVFDYAPRQQDTSIMFYTEEIDTSNYIGNFTMSFKHMLDWDSNTFNLSVQTSTDGVTWNTVWNISPTGDITAETVEVVINSSMGAGSSSLQVGFVWEGADTYDLNYWYIDDFGLSGTLAPISVSLNEQYDFILNLLPVLIAIILLILLFTMMETGIVTIDSLVALMISVIIVVATISIVLGL